MDNRKAIERSTLDVLLECLNRLDGLVTTSIVPSEKPDFIITCADKKIGVETTWAVYQEVVRAGKLQLSQCQNSWIDLTDLKDRETRRSNKEILKRVTNPLGSWKKVEDVKLDWKNKIAMALKSKRQKYNQADYQVFDENWLLIYDFPPLQRDPPQIWAGRYLIALFLGNSDVPRDFDTMFVLSGQYLFRWHKQQLQLANPAIINPLTSIALSP